MAQRYPANNTAFDCSRVCITGYEKFTPQWKVWWRSRFKLLKKRAFWIDWRDTWRRRLWGVTFYEASRYVSAFLKYFNGGVMGFPRSVRVLVHFCVCAGRKIICIFCTYFNTCFSNMKYCTGNVRECFFYLQNMHESVKSVWKCIRFIDEYYFNDSVGCLNVPENVWYIEKYWYLKFKNMYTYILYSIGAYNSNFILKFFAFICFSENPLKSCSFKKHTLTKINVYMYNTCIYIISVKQGNSIEIKKPSGPTRVLH